MAKRNLRKIPKQVLLQLKQLKGRHIVAGCFKTYSASEHRAGLLTQFYVMLENWEKLSKRSRIELFSGRYGPNIERVVHARGWKAAVNEIFSQRRTK